MSSDSCESLAKDPTKSSPMSPVSENRTLGSPAVGSLSSPGSTLDNNEFKRTQQVNRGADIEAIRPFLGSDNSKTAQRSAMESQLMTEIKDKSKHDHHYNLKHDWHSDLLCESLLVEAYETRHRH